MLLLVQSCVITVSEGAGDGDGEGEGVCVPGSVLPRDRRKIHDIITHHTASHHQRRDWCRVNVNIKWTKQSQHS